MAMQLMDSPAIEQSLREFVGTLEVDRFRRCCQSIYRLAVADW